MDAKITKKRLSRLLSYDWIKIVAIAVAAVLVWMLIFTMTATKITPSQQFTVFNYYCNGALTDEFYDLYGDMLSGKKFSYEVIETNVNDLPTSGKEYAHTLLEARLATNEGDVMFVPAIDDTDAVKETNEETGETTYYTYAESFFRRYFYNVYELYGVDEETGELSHGYFYDMEQFLSEYYADWKDESTLDQDKVKSDFRARIKKNKDKRFKKSAEISQGEKDEIKRIESYRDALEQFYAYLDAGVIAFTELTVENEGEILRQGNFAINLCPDTDTMGGLSNYVYYTTTVTDEETDEEQPITTAKDMQVMFFDMPDLEESYQYENVLFLNELIAACITASETNE